MIAAFVLSHSLAGRVAELGSLRMSRLHSVLSFFALPGERQVELLPEIPRDRGESDYYTT
jgi:hypothetical protein